MKQKTYTIAFLALLLIGGCSGSKENSGLALLKTTNPAPATIPNHKLSEESSASKIKKDISSFPEIYDVAVVQGKKDTLVAYKVKHLQRFRMKAIEKKINKLLEKRYPNENFKVSSDYKIFLEAVKLKEKMNHPNYSAQKAEKQLQAIIKLKDETT